MTMETVRAFRQHVEGDAELRARIEAIEPGPDALTAFLGLASGAGFPFTPTDLETFMRESGAEMSEEQLEQISGGPHYRSWDNPNSFMAIKPTSLDSGSL